MSSFIELPGSANRVAAITIEVDDEPTAVLIGDDSFVAHDFQEVDMIEDVSQQNISDIHFLGHQFLVSFSKIASTSFFRLARSLSTTSQTAAVSIPK